MWKPKIEQLQLRLKSASQITSTLRLEWTINSKLDQNSSITTPAGNYSTLTTRCCPMTCSLTSERKNRQRSLAVFKCGLLNSTKAWLKQVNHQTPLLRASSSLVNIPRVIDYNIKSSPKITLQTVKQKPEVECSRYYMSKSKHTESTEI